MSTQSVVGLPQAPTGVFVYGSLKSGEANARLASDAISREPAVATGELFEKSNGFPAMTLAGTSTVHGELLRFPDMPRALSRLDQLERFRSDRPDLSRYQRVAATVVGSGNRPTQAWVYVYPQETLAAENATPVTSGEWHGSGLKMALVKSFRTFQSAWHQVTAPLSQVADRVTGAVVNRLANHHEDTWRQGLGDSGGRCVVGVPCTPLQAALGPHGSLQPYLAAVVSAGGEPRLLLPSRGSAAAQVENVDAMLLPGGYDLDPATYGSIKGAGMQTSTTLPSLDAFSIACAQTGFHLLTPMLGICRGLQVMNVAAGGTLIQDIPTEFGVQVEHKSKSGPRATHSVSIAPDSNLARLLESTETIVNSAHHQAIGQLGSGFHVTATAADGIPEAAERTGVPSQWGVQFHPEGLVKDQPVFRNLFTALIENGAAARP